MTEIAMQEGDRIDRRYFVRPSETRRLEDEAALRGVRDPAAR